MVGVLGLVVVCSRPLGAGAGVVVLMWVWYGSSGGRVNDRFGVTFDFNDVWEGPHVIFSHSLLLENQ